MNPKSVIHVIKTFCILKLRASIAAFAKYINQKNGFLLEIIANHFLSSLEVMIIFNSKLNFYQMMSFAALGCCIITNLLKLIPKHVNIDTSQSVFIQCAALALEECEQVMQTAGYIFQHQIKIPPRKAASLPYTVYRA